VKQLQLNIRSSSQRWQRLKRKLGTMIMAGIKNLETSERRVSGPSSLLQNPLQTVGLNTQIDPDVSERFPHHDPRFSRRIGAHQGASLGTLYISALPNNSRIF
jgi:hypothetical protein